MTLAGFGATAGFFALFFFGEVPIVRKDILSVGSQICTYWWYEEELEADGFSEGACYRTEVHQGDSSFGQRT